MMKEESRKVEIEEYKKIRGEAERYTRKILGRWYEVGRYENAGREAIKEGTLEYSENEELAIISLKVLDAISENSQALPVKYAMAVLDDAKSMLLQLLGV